MKAMESVEGAQSGTHPLLTMVLFVSITASVICCGAYISRHHSLLAEADAAADRAAQVAP